MIKRIKVLKGIGRFTCLESTPGTEGDFAKLNVIYARNACGKSTLCDVFRSLGSGEPAYVIGRRRIGTANEPEVIISFNNGTGDQTARFQGGTWRNRDDCPPIHVYDDRFVSENVLIGHHVNTDQRKNLYGLVIGQRAIQLKEAVDDAEEELRNATESVNTTRNSLKAFIPEGYTLETFKDLPFVDEVDAKLVSASRELREVEQTKEKADAVRKRPPLSPVPTREVPTDLAAALSATLDTAALMAEQKIREHLARTSSGLSIGWVQQGHRAQIGTACPHCGQDMQGLEILRAYHAFFSGELQEQDRVRAETTKTIESDFGDNARNAVRATLLSHETERNWWQDSTGYVFDLPRLPDVEKILAAHQKAGQALLDALARKSASPTLAIALSGLEEQALAEWKLTAGEIQNYNEELRQINSVLDKRKSEAGAIDLVPIRSRLASLNASKKRFEKSVVDAYAAFDSALRRQADAQQAKKDANEALREQSNQVFSTYGTKINEILTFFAADFKVVSDGVKFSGGKPSGQLAVELLGTRITSTPEAASDPSKLSLANTLSGGDRSALALAYFIAQVRLDPTLKDCIVMFDDPYHNQDRSRRQCTIERIHQIAKIARQSFVLSHELEFARAVVQCPDAVTKTYEIDMLANPPMLTAKNLPMLPSRAYENNYITLSDYLKNPGTYRDHLRDIADRIRIILEEYMRLKFPSSWKEDDWLGDMIKSIREATPDSPLFHCQSLVIELNELNAFSKRFHHASSGESADEPDPKELDTFVQRTLGVIHAGGTV